MPRKRPFADKTNYPPRKDRRKATRDVHIINEKTSPRDFALARNDLQNFFLDALDKHHGGSVLSDDGDFDPELMAEYYANQKLGAELEREKVGVFEARDPDAQGALNRESIWTCRDGRQVAIKDMDDKHLLNTIRMLKGESPLGTTWKCSAPKRRELLNIMCNEAYRRGLQLL